MLNSNAAVEEAFGDVNMLAIEDLISVRQKKGWKKCLKILKELVTVGPHFDKVHAFLAPFQLASAGGTMKKKDQVISFAKGGINGDRGDKINELIRKMTWSHTFVNTAQIPVLPLKYSNKIRNF